jgi:hypothetical protein
LPKLTRQRSSINIIQDNLPDLIKASHKMLSSSKSRFVSQDKTKQDNRRYDKSRQDKTRQMTRQDKTRQDKIRQRQNKQQYRKVIVPVHGKSETVKSNTCVFVEKDVEKDRRSFVL